MSREQELRLLPSVSEAGAVTTGQVRSGVGNPSLRAGFNPIYSFPRASGFRLAAAPAGLGPLARVASHLFQELISTLASGLNGFHIVRSAMRFDAGAVFDIEQACRSAR